MSSRETVIALVSRLPEDMPLAEIARKIELLAGLKAAREQARRREGIPAEDARKLVDAWTAKQSSLRNPSTTCGKPSLLLPNTILSAPAPLATS